jgi:phosphatidylglycerol:prolipoprotein diacylglycerol transferase
MDFAIPYLVLGQGIGRWGNFVNQEAFGAKTNLPWRMNGTVPNDYLNSLQENLDLAKWGVHPTFLYESLWDIAVFLFLIFYRKRKKVEGEVLFLYLIMYGVGRFLIEGLRTDSLMLGNLRVSQLLSLLLVLVFTTLFIHRRIKKSKAADEETVDLGHSQYGSLLMKMKEEEQEEQGEEAAEIHAINEEEALKNSDGNQNNDVKEEAAQERPEDTKDDMIEGAFKEEK